MTAEKKPLVSIFLSVYNVEEYIVECMDSLIHQTYPTIEIIVIDDCSTDKTYPLLQKYEKHPAVKLFRNTENLHIPRSLNFALTQVKGDYLVHLDGDDYFELDRVEVMVNYLLQHPEVDIVGSGAITITPDGKEIKKTNFFSNPELLLKIIKYRSPVNHYWATKAEVYKKLGGYRVGTQGVEDYDFLLRAVSAGMTLSNIQDYYGYYMRVGRDGNTVSSIGVRQRKMHDYVYNLFMERLNTGSDSYSIEEFNRATSANAWEKWTYNLSALWLNKAIKTKNPIKKAFLVLGCFISYHQVKYLFYAWQYHRITRKFSHSSTQDETN